MARLTYFQKAARASEPARAALPTSHALLQRWELLARAQDSLSEAPTVSRSAPVASTVEQGLSEQRTPHETAIPPASRNTFSETQPESAPIVQTTSSTPAPQHVPEPEADELSLTTQEPVEPTSTPAQGSAKQSSESVASPTSTTASSINKDVPAGSTAEEIHLPEPYAAPPLKKDGRSQVETPPPHAAPDAREATVPEKASPIPQQKENSSASSTERREEKKGAEAIQTLQPARQHKLESEPVSQERHAEAQPPLREYEARTYETDSPPPPKQQQRERQQVLLTPQPHEPLEKSARQPEPAASAQPSLHIGEINVQVLPPPTPPPVVPAPREARPLSPPKRAATLSRGLTSVFGLRQG